MFDIKCNGAGNHNRSIEHFRPSEGEKFSRKRKAFDEAFDTYMNNSTDENKHILQKVCTKLCDTCRLQKKQSRIKNTTQEGACREYWYMLKATAKCIDCDATDGIDFDHQTDKVQSLSQYNWWAFNGGIEAMKREAEKCIPRCSNCHAMQHSHNKFKRATNPCKALCNVWRKKDEKYAYVNSKKLEIGYCCECNYKVTTSNFSSFDFAHKDANTKLHSKDSVSNICNIGTRLSVVQPKLDELMSMCRLLCKNCHRHETKTRNETNNNNEV
tara:strand:- start:321 stop:1130 length:810 start_codon:yes stop_codon:yes gene_type:complete